MIEPKAGRYVMPKRLRRRLDFYKENNIGILYLLAYSNNVAYPDDAFNAKAFGQYAAAVAHMLTRHGVRFALEVWNEPHNFELKPKLGGKWNAAPPSPWVDQYLKMVHEAVRAVKAVDSIIPIMTNEDVIVAHYWFLEKGLPRDLDGFAIHPYTHGRSIGPEVMPYDDKVKWARPFTVIDPVSSFDSMIRRLRREGAKRLGRTPEIWITEWGYPIGLKGAGPGIATITEKLSAAYLTRLYIQSVAAGVKGVFWHTMQDMRDGPYGLLRNDDSRRLSYDALKTLSRCLADTRLIRKISGQDHPTRGVQAYLFYGPSGYQLVAYSVDGPVKVLLSPINSALVRIKDYLGRSLPMVYKKGEPLTLKLNEYPIYVQGVGAKTEVRLRP